MFNYAGLPAEILKEILDHAALLDDRYPQLARQRALVTMSHVCQNWRSHLLLWPKLWVTLAVDLSHCPSSEALESYLRLSKDHLLQIAFYYRGHSFDAKAKKMVPCLNAVQSRWKSCHFLASNFTFSPTVRKFYFELLRGPLVDIQNISVFLPQSKRYHTPLSITAPTTDLYSEIWNTEDPLLLLVTLFSSAKSIFLGPKGCKRHSKALAAASALSPSMTICQLRQLNWCHRIVHLAVYIKGWDSDPFCLHNTDKLYHLPALKTLTIHCLKETTEQDRTYLSDRR